MLPLRHNFLPPEKRHYLQNMVHFQFTKNILEILLISLCLAGITLLGGQWVLQDYFNQLTEQIASINNQYSSTNKEIKDINQVLLKTEKIQNEYILWTKKMTEFTNTIPPAIILNSLSIDPKTKALNFAGAAPTREELLELQKNIKTLGWIDSLEIPLSQLTAKENIQFSLTAKMK